MATATRAKAKPVSVVASDGTPELTDTGFCVAPKCEDCWLRECVLLLSVAERHKLADALRVIKTFAQPDLVTR